MMPESETVCLACQETGGRRRQKVLDLPNLRAVRERAGMTRKELEEIVGISRFRLHLVEEGERRVKARTARKIAAALGTMVEGLSEGSCEGAARRTTATKPSTKGAA